jgi:hypothetical protein
VHVKQRLQQLLDEFGRLALAQRAVQLQEAVQVAPLAQLQYEVDVVGVLEVPVQAHDAVAPQARVDADLLRHAVLHPVPRDAFLLHDLQRAHLAAAAVPRAVHRREPPAPDQLAHVEIVDT